MSQASNGARVVDIDEYRRRRASRRVSLVVAPAQPAALAPVWLPVWLWVPFWVG